MPKFSKPERKVSKVFIHCSASDNPKHDDISVIRYWHIHERKWVDVGYHYFIKRDGTRQPGRSLEAIPAAQKGHNTGSIAICLSGLHNFTEAQFLSLKTLLSEINAEIPGVTVWGHCDVEKGKTCPNFDVMAVLKLNKERRLPS